MKFFSTALTALAVGSAVAAPVLERPEFVPDVSGPSGLPTPDVSVPSVGLPTPSASVPSVGLPTPSASVPPVGLSTPCTTITSETVISTISETVIATPTGIPVPVPGGGDATKEVTVVIAAVFETVSVVETKVKSHLSLIAKLVSAVEVDGQALFEVLGDLEGDLKALADVTPTLDGLVIEAKGLVAGDLEAVLSLLVKVKTLVANIQGTLKVVVGLKEEILALIGPKLKAVLGLVDSGAGCIVKFSLTVVSVVKANFLGDLLELAGKITSCAGLINGLVSGCGSLLAPALQLLNL